MTMNLTALLLLADSRLPAGTHAHSGGLEAAVAAKRVEDAASLRAFLLGRLATVGLTTAAFAAAVLDPGGRCQRRSGGGGTDDERGWSAGSGSGDAHSRSVRPDFSGERGRRAGLGSGGEGGRLVGPKSGGGHGRLAGTNSGTGGERPTGPDSGDKGRRPGFGGESGQLARLDFGDEHGRSAGPGSGDEGGRLIEPEPDFGSESEWLALLDAELDARTPSPAHRRASRALGRQLVRAVRAGWSDPVLDAVALVHPSGPHQPIAFGAAGLAAGLDSFGVAAAAALGAVTGPASAATRLMGIDPDSVTAVLASLEGAVQQTAAAAVAAARGPVEDLPSLGAPRLDISAEHHSTWEVRLFAS